MLKKTVLMLMLISAVCITLNAAEKYAILIAGDYTAANVPADKKWNDGLGNNTEFWNDLYLQWEMLYQKGYKKENIKVLFAHGIDLWNVDGFQYIDPRYRAYNATGNIEDRIVNYPVTTTGLNSAISEISSTNDDFLYVWVMSHGGGSTQSSIGFIGTGTQPSFYEMTPSEFAGKINAIPAFKKEIVLSLNYAQGFKNVFTGSNVRVELSSTNTKAHRADDKTKIDTYYPYLENELINGNIYYHGEFNFHKYCSLMGQTQYGSSIYPSDDTSGPYPNPFNIDIASTDANNDGQYNFTESYNWIATHQSDLLNSTYTDFKDNGEVTPYYTFPMGDYSSLDYPTLVYNSFGSAMEYFAYQYPTKKGTVGIAEDLNIANNFFDVNLGLYPNSIATILDDHKIDVNEGTYKAGIVLSKNTVLKGQNNNQISLSGGRLSLDNSIVKDIRIDNYAGSVFVDNSSEINNVKTTLLSGNIDFEYPTGVKLLPQVLKLTNNSELMIEQGKIQGNYNTDKPDTVSVTDGSRLSIGYEAIFNRIILKIEQWGIYNYSNNAVFNNSEVNVANSGQIVFPSNGTYTPAAPIYASAGGQLLVDDNATLNLSSGTVVNLLPGSRVTLSETAMLNSGGFTFPSSTALQVADKSNISGNLSFSAGSSFKTAWQSEVNLKSGSIVKMNQANLYVDYGSTLVIEFGANLTLYGPMRVIMCPGSKIINRGILSISPDVIFTTNIDPTNPNKSLDPWDGVVNEPGSSFTISGAEFENVQTAINGVGSTVNINRCKFTDCTNGINLSACSKITIANNIFTGNDNGIAVTLIQSDGNVTHNTITGFYKGINVMSCSPTLVQNTISDCYLNGLYVAGNNTYMSMVNPIQIGGTIKSGDELGIDNSELNNTLHNNGIDYVPPPLMFSKASQIYMVSNSNIYLAKGWNNIYSDANQVPCIRTIGLLPEGEPVRMQLIYAPENFWGYGTVNNSLFALSLPYYIDYSYNRSSPYGTNPVYANVSGNENAQKLLGKAFGCELDGKYDKAIKEYEKIIDKYPESTEAMVAYAKLPENYQMSKLSFDPLLAVYDNKLANENSNKKFFKELKVSSHIKAKNYDSAIALSEEMKLEADTEEELILCDIDIAIANMLKNSNNKSGSKFDQSSLSELQDKLNGSRSKTNPSDITEASLPLESKLYQNYPNPFNPVTQIKFDLAKTTDVQLSVYNVSGQIVAELADGIMNAGSHSVEFDGSKLNSGVYYYTLEANGQKLTSKMVLTK
ncbi:MAG TPA: T9SS type A sorting domain-containing protein [Clostridiales bacterium]|nr:T9SS type A sorting domain-containing protein [Clostridiales bacterium]HQP69475.1 T9SS type A sorting domain-containing protein [Clostridiales bacterium]